MYIHQFNLTYDGGYDVYRQSLIDGDIRIIDFDKTTRNINVMKMRMTMLNTNEYNRKKYHFWFEPTFEKVNADV